ncbi:MAG: M20/M25/M40 family metallo-hydrolase [Mucilaginibacter sp.]|uniref:M20/M25/M40 family metallo-hydrolase n=1 Tax=Mucilaginibacter sp. TaxID=1882438 RepID=UPI003263D765
MKLYIAVACLLGVFTQMKAQDVNKNIKEKNVKRIIKTLSADNMLGRATGTPGIEKAAKFIEKEYKKIGLVPLSGNSSFRQNFNMAKILPLKTEITINGKVIAADSALVISGAPAIHWASNSDVEVAKIGADKNFQSAYRGYARLGKKMLILVDSSFKQQFKSSVYRYKQGVISQSPNADQNIVLVLGAFNNVDVKTFSVEYTAKIEQAPLFNIAGMLPGKSKEKEYVIFSGHYDHLGILPPIKSDSIANGADDDASGTTAVIALAKYYKKLKKNERTLIFVAFTAEEIGGFGASYFSKQLNADSVVAMFNIEMIGKASKFGANSAFITGYERSDFGAILQRNLLGTAFKFYPDPYPEQNLFYRSDNATLARLGVPAHSISTDQIPTDKLYHSVGDDVASLDVANITSTIRAIALSSRSIVEGKDTPKRVAKLER